MASHSPDHADPRPVTDRLHTNSWSANLEGPEHADNPELVVEQAIEAIDHTASGYHVNLVTHAELGHPSTYLYGEFEGLEVDRDLSWEYVDQCGCGGHVTRVHVG